MKKLLLGLLCIGWVCAQNVGINTATPDPTAALEVKATDKGLLPPRLTTAQRNAIVSPAEGLMIYNTDTKCMEFWNTLQWISTCADVAPCSPPPASTPGSNTPVCEGSTLNLTATPVGGATYVWSGPDGFSSTSQNPSIAGMTMAKAGTYYLRTWALGCYSNENSTSVSVVTNPWVSRAAYPGSARQGCASFSLGSYGYVVGGRSGCNDQADLYQYDPATNSWTARAAAPAQRSYAGTFSGNGLGYLVGGHRDDVCASNTNLAYSYNPGTDSWAAITSFPGGTRSYSFQNSQVGNMGYFGLGGTSGGCFTSDFYSYNTISGTWTLLTAYPLGNRALQGTFSIGDTLYLCCGEVWGGWSGGCPTAQYNELYAYNTTTGTWAARAAFPGGSGSPLASFAIGSKGYVINSSRVVYEYNPATNSWTALPCPYPGVAGSFRMHTSFVVGGTAYVVDPQNGTTHGFTP